MDGERTCGGRTRARGKKRRRRRRQRRKKDSPCPKVLVSIHLSPLIETEEEPHFCDCDSKEINDKKKINYKDWFVEKHTFFVSSSSLGVVLLYHNLYVMMSLQIPKWLHAM